MSQPPPEPPPDPPPRPRLSELRPEALMGLGLSLCAADVNPPAIDGFEVGRLIGRGGMGRVYLARQTSLDREVCVKLIAAEWADDPQFLARLEREAHSMAKLRHPNIVTVHHFEPLAGGGAAMVMEYVAGGNLRERIRSCPGGMPVAEARARAREIASALGAAHDSGVIHRDVKPENILIDRHQDAARVTDFGLAVPIDEASTQLTLSGTTVGTLDYLAPERFTSSTSDARGDIYALGVVLYEMLTGEVPRGNFATPRQLRPEVPEFLSEATMRALRQDPEGRYASMGALAKAIDAPPARLTRRPWFIPAAGAVALGLASVTWKALAPSANPDSPAPAFAPVADEAQWESLLPFVDLDAAVVSGRWQRDGGYLISNDEICILSLKSQMPESYDVRAHFARVWGAQSVAVFVTANGSLGSVDIDGWSRHLSGVQSVDGLDLRQRENFDFPLENSRIYQLLIEVRPGALRVLIDGEEKARFDIGSEKLGIVAPWNWDGANPAMSLGIGSYKSTTRFEKLEWRPAP